MNWFSRLFSTRRELKRLAAENELLRGKVILLEAANTQLVEKCFGIYRYCLDRFLTGVVKTYAVGDEIEQASKPKVIVDRARELEEYLEHKSAEIYRQAQEADPPVSAIRAEEVIKASRYAWKEEFESQFV